MDRLWRRYNLGPWRPACGVVGCHGRGKGLPSLVLPFDFWGDPWGAPGTIVPIDGDGLGHPWRPSLPPLSDRSPAVILNGHSKWVGPGKKGGGNEHGVFIARQRVLLDTQVPPRTKQLELAAIWAASPGERALGRFSSVRLQKSSHR